MYPVLYLTIGPGERIAGGTTQSVIRVHDTYTGYTAGPPVNSEAIADLTSTNHWQVWNGTAWVTASVAPAP